MRLRISEWEEEEAHNIYMFCPGILNPFFLSYFIFLTIRSTPNKTFS